MGSETKYSDSFITAISEKELALIDVKLGDYIDYISKSFNNLNDLIDESNSYFKGDFADSFVNKYSQYQSYHSCIIENLNSFKTDLVNVMKNYIGFNKSITTSEVKVNDIEGKGDLNGVNKI